MSAGSGSRSARTKTGAGGGQEDYGAKDGRKSTRPKAVKEDQGRTVGRSLKSARPTAVKEDRGRTVRHVHKREKTGEGPVSAGLQPGKNAGSDHKKAVWKAGNMLYPLPAVMVSCARPGERPDIVTVAWAGTVCTDPAMVSISLRPSRYSYGIIDETGEFVINLVTEELIRACDFCGVKSGRDTDKFLETGLTALPAVRLSFAPLIAQSPVNIECRVVQKLTPGSHHIFLARVEAVDIDEDRLDENGKFELNKAGLAAYSHGEYFALGRKLGSFGFSVKKGAKTDRVFG